MIGWFIKWGVQTFQPLIIIIFRRSHFVYHHWCTSIYQPLIYPFRSMSNTAVKSEDLNIFSWYSIYKTIRAKILCFTIYIKPANFCLQSHSLKFWRAVFLFRIARRYIKTTYRTESSLGKRFFIEMIRKKWSFEKRGDNEKILL